jgi:hypothetical protein
LQRLHLLLRLHWLRLLRLLRDLHGLLLPQALLPLQILQPHILPRITIAHIL